MCVLFFMSVFFSSSISDTRETGFVNAITAAGVTYAVTRACTMGDLVECSCDKNHRRHHSNNNNNNNNNNDLTNNAANNNNNNNNRLNLNKKFGKNIVMPDGDWEWGGCGDNVNFGLKKSKEFLDARYKRRSDIKTLVKLHNNDAGRMVSGIIERIIRLLFSKIDIKDPL